MKNAISKKVQKEFIAEFESKTKLMSLKTYFLWEEQFREAYTNVMFSKVQDEMDDIIYCTIFPIDESDVVIMCWSEILEGMHLGGNLHI